MEDAPVRGRLFETSSGNPILLVPEENILAVGTTNPLADVATQAHITARMFNPEPNPRPAPKEEHRRALGPRVRGDSFLRSDVLLCLKAGGCHPWLTPFGGKTIRGIAFFFRLTFRWSRETRFPAIDRLEG